MSQTEINSEEQACFHILCNSDWRLQCHPGSVSRSAAALRQSYHVVSKMEKPGDGEHQLCYSAGVMVLSKEHPQVIRYRSVEPVLTPTLPQECSGTVAQVVFPTGIDRRDDLGLPNRFDVYYGMD